MSRNSPAIQLYIILIYFAHYRDVLDSYWSFFCRLLHLTNQAFESQWLHYTKSHSCNENKKPSLDIGLNIHKIILWCWYILRYNIQCNDHSVIKVEIVQIKKMNEAQAGHWILWRTGRSLQTWGLINEFSFCWRWSSKESNWPICTEFISHLICAFYRLRSLASIDEFECQ